MRPFTMFQRSVMMYMHLMEVIEGDMPMWFRRASFCEALGITWQNHYTKSMNELIDQKCVEQQKYFGTIEYMLTDQARVYFDQQRTFARRQAHMVQWQRNFVTQE